MTVATELDEIGTEVQESLPQLLGSEFDGWPPSRSSRSASSSVQRRNYSPGALSDA